MIVIYHKYVYKLYHVCAKSLQSCLSAALWTVAHQAPLFLEFSRQEYWRGVAMSSSRGSFRPRDLTLVSHVSCIGRWVLYHSWWQRNFITGIGKKQYKNQFGNIHGFKHPLGFLGSILSRYGGTIVVSKRKLVFNNGFERQQ